MNKPLIMKKSLAIWMTIMLTPAMLLAGCSSNARVGALQTESQSVDLGDAKAIRVEIGMGAGDLQVSGGAERLLEADFNYNVTALKPVVEYTDGKLVVRQPNIHGLQDLRGISGYRNEWDLRLHDDVPMDLSVELGGGVSNLQLAGLSLTGLRISLGAGKHTIDLSGEWARDLDVTIDAGAAELNLKLPRDVGARVDVQAGPHTIEAIGLKQDGDVYTNAAYGLSKVTLQIEMEAGIGRIRLEGE